MQQYMVEFRMPEELTEDFMALLSSQRKCVDEFLAVGTLLSYTVALERRKLWAVLQVCCEDDAWDVIDLFPLSNFLLASVTLIDLHDVGPNSVGQFSLN